MRTFVPHMACGVSLEAAVLPALGIAAVCEQQGALGAAYANAADGADVGSGASAGGSGAAAARRLPSDAVRKEAAATIRQA